MNSVARSALARMLSFIPTAIATLLTSRLILHEYGVASFDSFALILTLISLVPLTNLGVGAAVTSAYADATSTSDQAHRVTLTAARTLIVSSVATAAVAMLISAADAWTTLLGSASGPRWYTGLAVALYALSFPAGLGQSVLLGVHRNHVVVWMQTFFTPLIAVGVGVVIATHSDAQITLLIPPAALIAVNLLTCWQASRATNISWGRIAGDVFSRGRHPGASIRALSGPMLIITITGPIALQSDRIVLSHVSTAQAVANYSVVLQIFAPVIALIAASAQPLWPIYTRARSEGKRGPHVGRVTLVFAVATAAVCALLVLVADPIGELIGSKHINLGVALPTAAALAVLAQAIGYPVGMALMDRRGVRVVAVCALIGLPVNIAVSVVLAKHLGAPGPLIGTFAVTLVLQTIPALIFAMRRTDVGEDVQSPSQPYAYDMFTIPLLDSLPTSYDELHVYDHQRATTVPPPPPPLPG